MSTLKNGCGCGPQASPPDQPSVQTASGYVRRLHSTNFGAAGQFSCHPRGWRRGCCTCYGCTYPLKPGMGVVKKGLSWNRSCLNVLAGGNRGGPSTRRHHMLRCRTCLTYDIDIRCRTSCTYDIVEIQCRTCMTYDIVCNIGIIRCRTSDVRHRTSARIQMVPVLLLHFGIRT